METNKLIEIVISRLEKELPFFLYYHSPEHTLNVIDRAVFLAEKENLPDNEIELIKVAALYHDAGFLIGRNDHETKSCHLANQELPAYGYTQLQIKEICGMINATRIPQKTSSLKERIVADADLFYLGTNQYDFHSHQLYKELRHINPGIDQKQWFEIQLNFLNEHSFHTQYAKEVLGPVKNENIEKLLKEQARFLEGLK